MWEKNIKEPPNVTKIQLYMMLVLYNVRMKQLNVRGKEKKEITKCNKSVVKCDVEIVQCKNEIVKCDVVITWYTLPYAPKR